MSTCNQLDLQTLGSQPIMPKNLADHCMVDVNPPPSQTFRGCQIRAGGKFLEFFLKKIEDDQKLLPTPFNFEKNIALAFLKAA